MLERYRDDTPLWADLGWWQPAILALGALVLALVLGALIGGL